MNNSKVSENEKKVIKQYSMAEINGELTKAKTKQDFYWDKRRLLNIAKQNIDGNELRDYYTMDVKIIVQVNRENISDNGEINWDEVYRDTGFAISEGFQKDYQSRPGITGTILFNKHTKLKMSYFEFAEFQRKTTNLVNFYMVGKVPNFEEN